MNLHSWSRAGHAIRATWCSCALLLAIGCNGDDDDARATVDADVEVDAGGGGEDTGSAAPDLGGRDSGGPALDLGGPGDGGLPDVAPRPDVAPEPEDAGLPQDSGVQPDLGQPLEPAACLGEEDLTDRLATWPVGTVIKTAGRGWLATQATADGPIYLPVLRGSHYQMGCQYGYLIAEPMAAMWDEFLENMIGGLIDSGEVPLSRDQLVALIESVLNSVWLFMQPYVPAEFLEELRGVADGQTLAGVPREIVELRFVLVAMTVLANVSDSGSLDDLADLARFVQSGHSTRYDEYFAPPAGRGAWFRRVFQAMGFGPARRQTPPDARRSWTPAELAVLGRIPIPRHSCSILGAWGPQTRDGHLIAMRNLDWNADTGMRAVKALTFWIPDDGLAHVTVGYLGMLGSLSGLNEQGVVLGEVGSTGVLERMQGEPWTLKHREILLRAHDLDEALALVTNTRDDGRNRPQTIGYNWLVGWGDPEQQGVRAEAAVAETNAIFTAVHRQRPDCTASTTVVELGPDGRPAAITTQADDPLLANLEADAVEIDAAGQPRRFQVDAQGEHVRDADGNVIPDPAGQPLRVARTQPCAVFRGDEALGHAVRRWQLAANGPQGNPEGLVSRSNSYRHRYSTLAGMLAAYRTGGSYTEDGEELVPELAGVPQPIGLAEGVALARAAAMDGNVYSVAYDATALTLRVAYESGTGETWQAASANEYHLFDVKSIMELAR